MGSSTLIDIVGSMIIGGFLLLAALRMNDSATRNNFQMQENLTVQQNLRTLVQFIERDFRRMGYRQSGNPPADSCIVYGDTNRVQFIGDIDNDGVLDNVTWRYVPPPKPPALNYVPNPNVGLLIRTDVDGGTTIVDTEYFGVTQFWIKYFDAFNHYMPGYVSGSSPIPVLMQVTLEIQPTTAYDTAYSTNFGFWTETRLVSRNLTGR
jgi:hypothetical protein